MKNTSFYVVTVYDCFLITVVAFFVSACGLAGDRARADEGMWLFNAVPEELLSRDVGFVPSRAWLSHLQESAVRFNSGGSGAFVSPDGLVLTNHHVAASSLQKLSTPERNLARDGYLARSHENEIRVLILNSTCFVLLKTLRHVLKKPLPVREVHQMHWWHDVPHLQQLNKSRDQNRSA